MKTYILGIGISMLLLVSCKKSTATVTCTSSTTISYAQEIAPLMNSSCVSCHNSSVRNGGIDLSSYSKVSQNATSSLSAIQNGSMPPSGKLSDASIQKLSCWISQGKQNN